jgi:gamma-glutamylcyclotransferase (GGCT)/AIG2-like uncharacterized protein YtfP
VSSAAGKRPAQADPRPRSAGVAPRLFVYGSLRKALGHEMHHVLARAAHFLGHATVRGALYDLGAYPGLVTAAAGAGLVSGEVYLLAAETAEATLTILDAYEGCARSDPEPQEYRREVVPVSFDDDTEGEAWTYVLNRPHAGLPRIPGGDYVAWRRRGG